MSCLYLSSCRKINLLGNIPCFWEVIDGMSLWEKLKSPFIKKRESTSPPGDVHPEGTHPAEGRPAALTRREQEVFHLLVEGYTLRETAQRLGLKYSTVNTHMTGIYRKLGVNSRAELIIRYRDYDKEDSK